MFSESFTGPHFLYDNELVVNFQVRPGTQPGQKVVLRKKGIPLLTSLVV